MVSKIPDSRPTIPEKCWSLLPTVSAPMPFQMALDEILFELVRNGSPSPYPLPLKKGEGKGEGGWFPVLRFYFSSEPWVTVGYSNRAVIVSPVRDEAISDLRLLRRFAPRPPKDGSVRLLADNDGVPVCRRITGGGRVEHGKDLIFSLTARTSEDGSFSSVRMSYLKIHEVIKAALEAFELKPFFYRCDERLPRGNDCFHFPIATDLRVGNRKVAGGAQKRSAGALLHQESIQGMGSLDPKELIRVLREKIEERFEVKCLPSDLDPELWIQAKALAASKYQTWPEEVEEAGALAISNQRDEVLP